MDVREGRALGWRTVTLENEHLRVTVLPEKGADIVEIVDRTTGLDPLFKAPWGLQPPGFPPREGSDGRVFLQNYEGGWQELFPNAQEEARYRGRTIPFHGEVASLAWSADRTDGGVTFSVDCRRTPFRLERTMALKGGALVLAETVTNRESDPAHFVWGHHCVVGPPFLEAGCRLRLAATTLVTPEEPWEDTNRLEPGQRARWPHGRLRSGGTVDLSLVPGPEAGTHDDVYVTGLSDGRVEVENPRLPLAFRLEWDARVFPWLVAWQPYGGASAMPLRGTYALGIEPWSSSVNLERAAATGEASVLAGGETLVTELRATFVRASRR